MANIKKEVVTKEYYEELALMIDEWKLDQETNHTNRYHNLVWYPIY